MFECFLRSLYKWPKMEVDGSCLSVPAGDGAGPLVSLSIVPLKQTCRRKLLWRWHCEEDEAVSSFLQTFGI